MGLIRKTLAVTTVGVVKGSSKKQRVAKKSLKEMKATNQLMEQQNALLARAAQVPAIEVAPPASLPGGNDELVAALERLAALHASGAISEAEFVAAKTKLI